jgi:hypothetical protein
MRKVLVLCSVLILFGVSAFAQPGKKPWTEWSQKDAEKVLNDSSWGQTQTEGGSDRPSTSVITSTASSGNSGRDLASSGESGVPKASQAVRYRVRFLTAKPIREAFARSIFLSQPNAGKEFADQLQAFVDRDFGSYLVVALSADSEDARMAAGELRTLGKLTTEALKEKVYLERKDGTRLPLSDYRAPIGDGMGAKLVFDRNRDGQPFLTEQSDTVRFVMELSSKVKLNVKFKVATMMYGGRLEY